VFTVHINFVIIVSLGVLSLPPTLAPGVLDLGLDPDVLRSTPHQCVDDRLPCKSPSLSFTFRHLQRRSSGILPESITTTSGKLEFFGHATWKPETCLEKKVAESTTSGTSIRKRPRTTWQDNTETWTGQLSGLSLAEAVMAT